MLDLFDKVNSLRRYTFTIKMVTSNAIFKNSDTLCFNSNLGEDKLKLLISRMTILGMGPIRLTDDMYVIPDNKSITVVCSGQIRLAPNSSSLFKFTNFRHIDLSEVDTSMVTTMQAMFSNCTRLESINLSNFNTSNVYSMTSMFNNCVSLKSLDIRHFDTSSLKQMKLMFNNCKNLTDLKLFKGAELLLTGMGE